MIDVLLAYGASVAALFLALAAFAVVCGFFTYIEIALLKLDARRRAQLPRAKAVRR